MAIEPGMNVRLRCGGPKMTVRTIDGDVINCDWFDKTSLKKADFLECMLEDADKLDELLGRIREIRENSDQIPENI
jgi:uncharacterized protein YodC (DUF2158 family)